MSRRKSFLDVCFGGGLRLFNSETPLTMMDVMRHYIYIKTKFTKNTDVEARIIVTDNIKNHFSTNNPTKKIVLSDKTIRDKIQKKWEKRNKFNKNQSCYQKSIIEFRLACRAELLDLSKCGCITESCCKHNKVSHKNKDILNVEIQNSDSDSENPIDENDVEFIPNSSSNKLNLSVSSELADRFNLSDRGFAAIASGVLTDLGLISSTDNKLVIDKNKVRRARAIKRKSEAMNLIFDGSALFFDGRKDDTLKTVEINGKSFFLFFNKILS